MADITFFCKHCGHELVCDLSGSGQLVPCPECGKQVTIPTRTRPSNPELIKFDCPACGQKIEAPSDMQGQDVDCPACSKVITIQSSTESQQVSPIQITERKETPSSNQGEGPNTKACPFCGETILAVAIKCKHCGSMLSNANQHVQNTSSHDGGMAPKPFGKLGIIALILPIFTAIFITPWLVTFEMGLLVGFGLVIVTAFLINAEARAVGAGAPNDIKPNGKHREGPIMWFIAIILLWIVCFPMWMFRRAQYGLRNLGFVSILVVIAYLALPIVIPTVVESASNGTSVGSPSNTGKLSIEELKKQVVASINEDLKRKRLKVAFDIMELKHNFDNEYVGELTICEDTDKFANIAASSQKVAVDVTYDGRIIRWKLRE